MTRSRGLFSLTHKLLEWGGWQRSALPHRDNQRNSGPPTCGKILFPSPLCCLSFQLDGRMGQAWTDQDELRGEVPVSLRPSRWPGAAADLSSRLCLLCQLGSGWPHGAPSRMGRWCMESISRGGRCPVATDRPHEAAAAGAG